MFQVPLYMVFLLPVISLMFTFIGVNVFQSMSWLGNKTQ
ncbi:hypothetical protein PULV_a0715 [Pseudoalteromonas ulvae UL12]|nr:hypothetical protein [Pseudoalteromonas ulvae UL12]